MEQRTDNILFGFPPVVSRVIFFTQFAKAAYEIVYNFFCFFFRYEDWSR
ncbi:MAG: hypothetical protein ACKOC0_10290 [Cytophagales bacterium]